VVLNFHFAITLSFTATVVIAIIERIFTIIAMSSI